MPLGLKGLKVMEEPRYDWSDESFEASRGNILQSTLKKVAIIVAFCIAALIAISGFEGFDARNERGRTSENGDIKNPSDLRSRPVSQTHDPLQDQEFLTELVLRAGAHGQFTVDAEVNGETVRFLVDTGASKVVLTPKDARRVGYASSDLEYTERFQTANGEVTAAPIELRSIRIGALEMRDVEASVNGGPLGISLLGMTFLGRLERYEIEDDRLVLAW